MIVRKLIRVREGETIDEALDRYWTALEKKFRREPFSEDAFSNALRRCEIHEGNTILVHSSWRKFYNFQGTPERAIKIMEDLIGETGTLAMPCYGSDRKYFDVQNTPSSAGVLSEVFRLQPGVKRSSCTHFSVAAKGQLADQLIAEHHLSQYGFDEHSPCFNLTSIPDAKIVFLGLGKEPTKISVFHCAGAILRESDPKLKKLLSNRYESVLVQNGIEEKKQMYIRQPGHGNSQKVFRQILRSIKSKKNVKLSNIDIVVIDAKEALAQSIKFTKEGKYCYKNMTSL